MDTVNLKDYGIDMLTGEACSFSLRILCDVTEQGKSLLERYFGVDKIDFAPNWNHGSDEHPNIGSITIGRHSLNDIRVFCGLSVSAYVMVEASGQVVTLSKEELDYLRADFPSQMEKAIVYYNPGYDRNLHQMSGRTY